MAKRLKNSEPTSVPDRRAHLAAAQQNSMIVQSRIAEHDAREERRMIELSRRAQGNMLTLDDLDGGMGGMPLSRSDVMLPDMAPQMLTERFPTGHDDAIMEELYNGPKTRQARPPRLLENARPASPSWAVKKFLGETRGGNTVAVWKVQNRDSGIAFDKLFRIEAVAHRIATLLNESNNIGDPRVVSVIRDYDKRDKLLKEARLLEKDTGDKPMKAARLRALRAEIASLDYKLGI